MAQAPSHQFYWQLVHLCRYTHTLSPNHSLTPTQKSGRHLIDWISDWPNPRGFTKGVRFVCLNRYVQVDRKPFGQSGSYEKSLFRSRREFIGHRYERWFFSILSNLILFGTKIETQKKFSEKCWFTLTRQFFSFQKYFFKIWLNVQKIL